MGGPLGGVGGPECFGEKISQPFDRRPRAGSPVTLPAANIAGTCGTSFAWTRAAPVRRLALAEQPPSS